MTLGIMHMITRNCHIQVKGNTIQLMHNTCLFKLYLIDYFDCYHYWLMNKCISLFHFSAWILFSLSVRKDSYSNPQSKYLALQLFNLIFCCKIKTNTKLNDKYFKWEYFQLISQYSNVISFNYFSKIIGEIQTPN